MKWLYLFLVVLLFSCNNNAQKDIFEIARHGTSTQMAELIKENSELINTKNKSGYSPLILACYHNNIEIIPFLIANGAHVNETSEMGTALLAASYKGNNKIAEILIAKGANVNSSDKKGTTALHFACRTKNKDLAKLLVKNNASINAKDYKGKIPLDYAIENNTIEIIKILQPK